MAWDGPLVSTAENTAQKQQIGRPFEPGQSGNPAGRPKGPRNRATLAVEVLLDGEAEGFPLLRRFGDFQEGDGQPPPGCDKLCQRFPGEKQFALFADDEVPFQGAPLGCRQLFPVVFLGCRDGCGVNQRQDRGWTGVIENGLEVRVEERLEIFDAGRENGVIQLFEQLAADGDLLAGLGCLRAIDE